MGDDGDDEPLGDDEEPPYYNELVLENELDEDARGAGGRSGPHAAAVAAAMGTPRRRRQDGEPLSTQPGAPTELSTPSRDRTNLAQPTRTSPRLAALVPAADMPMGPWQSLKEGKEALKTYFKSPRTWSGDHRRGLGGVGIRIRGRMGNPSSSAKGRKDGYRFECSRAGAGTGGSIRCGCKFGFEVHQSTDDTWHVASGTFIMTHNHPIAITEAAILASATTRSPIPEKLVTTAKAMYAQNAPVSQIHKVIGELHKLSGGEVNWSYKDLYTSLAPDGNDKRLDATSLIERLIQRYEETGLPYAYHSGEDGSLQRVFWVAKNAREFFHGVKTGERVLV
ncbi:MULE domain-containing transposase [Pseudoscourfieldia marina]